MWLLILLAFVAWVGHAFVWTTILNYVYARPYPKPVLRLWRHFTAVIILAFPGVLFLIEDRNVGERMSASTFLAGLYAVICFGFSCDYFMICVQRCLREPPATLLSETTTTLDLWSELGAKAIGDGAGQLLAKLPLNGIYNVDFTELTLAMKLPPEWDGLTILHLTDLHYHGTPSREWHERVMAEIAGRWPTNDLICLTGDYVDTDEHHAWIGPLLGRLQAMEGKFAILGNHDRNHDPERVRTELEQAGYTMLSNGWEEATIRGVPCVLIGHEGPWFVPPPDLQAMPSEPFHLGLCHTPDNFYWGQRHGIDLMLCGHVHGGQVRFPFISSIFVPSMYGRRFDMGVFERNGTVMVVGRGLSGKEPLRFRCNPQVIRITLRASAS